jgi:Plasmid encoded RepA protein
MDDENPTRPLTLAQKRFLEAAERIRADRPTLDDFAYMARELVQVTLPHRNPGDVPEWRRSNGNLTLSIRTGWTTDQKTGRGRPIGYPYGNLPRLLLFWLTAEAVAAKNRGDHSGRIELGNSLSDFMFQLGLNTDRGSVSAKRSDARRLREQMQRLFAANVSFEQPILGDGRRGEHRVNMTVASESMLWWNPQDPHQAALWGSWVELSKKFFDAIVAHPIPLDMRALKALKQSPLALDLYSWLTYEAYRAHKSGKGRFVAWRLLAQQMGTDYADVHDFQRKARAALRKIQVVYPALKLGPLRGGIRIEPASLPAITPQLIPSRPRPQPALPAAKITEAPAPSYVTAEQIAEARRGLSDKTPSDTPQSTAPEPLEDPATVRQRAARQGVIRPGVSTPAMRQRAKKFLVRFLQTLIELDENTDRLERTSPDGDSMFAMGPAYAHTPETKTVLRQILDDLLRVPDGSLGVEPPCGLTSEVERALQSVRDDLLRAELDDD